MTGLEALTWLVNKIPLVLLENNSRKCIEDIEKELKSLQIIKSKVVHTRLLMQYNNETTVDDYNKLNAREDSELLTQEDFDLLREILKNDKKNN